MKQLLLAGVTAFVLAWTPAAGAAEITLLAPGGIRAAITQMIPDFEKQTGHKVKAEFGSGVGTHDRIVKGEAVDVPVVQPPYDDVIKSGNVDAKKMKELTENWGKLLPKDRAQALADLTKDMPPAYREAIETYFKKIGETPDSGK